MKIFIIYIVYIYLCVTDLYWTILLLRLYKIGFIELLQRKV